MRRTESGSNPLWLMQLNQLLYGGSSTNTGETVRYCGILYKSVAHTDLLYVSESWLVMVSMDLRGDTDPEGEPTTLILGKPGLHPL